MPHFTSSQGNTDSLSVLIRIVRVKQQKVEGNKFMSMRLEMTAATVESSWATPSKFKHAFHCIHVSRGQPCTNTDLYKEQCSSHVAVLFMISTVLVLLLYNIVYYMLFCIIIQQQLFSLKNCPQDGKWISKIRFIHSGIICTVKINEPHQ